jgi:hypothetical protein
VGLCDGLLIIVLDVSPVLLYVRKFLRFVIELPLKVSQELAICNRFRVSMLLPEEIWIFFTSRMRRLTSSGTYALDEYGWRLSPSLDREDELLSLASLELARDATFLRLF